MVKKINFNNFQELNSWLDNSEHDLNEIYDEIIISDIKVGYKDITIGRILIGSERGREILKKNRVLQEKFVNKVDLNTSPGGAVKGETVAWRLLFVESQQEGILKTNSPLQKRFSEEANLNASPQEGRYLGKTISWMLLTTKFGQEFLKQNFALQERFSRETDLTAVVHPEGHTISMLLVVSDFGQDILKNNSKLQERISKEDLNALIQQGIDKGKTLALLLSSDFGAEILKKNHEFQKQFNTKADLNASFQEGPYKGKTLAWRLVKSTSGAIGEMFRNNSILQTRLLDEADLNAAPYNNPSETVFKLLLQNFPESLLDRPQLILRSRASIPNDILQKPTIEYLYSKNSSVAKLLLLAGAPIDVTYIQNHTIKSNIAKIIIEMKQLKNELLNSVSFLQEQMGNSTPFYGIIRNILNQYFAANIFSSKKNLIEFIDQFIKNNLETIENNLVEFLVIRITTIPTEFSKEYDAYQNDLRKMVKSAMDESNLFTELTPGEIFSTLSFNYLKNFQEKELGNAKVLNFSLFTKTFEELIQQFKPPKKRSADPAFFNIEELNTKKGKTSSSETSILANLSF